MTSLKNAYGPNSVPQRTQKNASVLCTNLRDGWVIAQGNPHRFDTDFRATLNAFPCIGKTAKADRLVTNSGKFTG